MWFGRCAFYYNYQNIGIFLEKNKKTILSTTALHLSSIGFIRTTWCFCQGRKEQPSRRATERRRIWERWSRHSWWCKFAIVPSYIMLDIMLNNSIFMYQWFESCYMLKYYIQYRRALSKRGVSYQFQLLSYTRASNACFVLVLSFICNLIFTFILFLHFHISGKAVYLEENDNHHKEAYLKCNR